VTNPAETVEVVRRTITVAAPPDRAFRVFADQLGSWWPREYHIGAEDMADFIVEPRAGGRWYELGVDGAECNTGTVLAYEPPVRLVLAWHLDENWQYDPDPEHASEVEVRFTADEQGGTRVDLEHRGFQRHGIGGPAVRGSVDSPGGWDFCLARYLDAFDAAEKLL
jgi:uncharacterized protein YndB with AHSA1/START domain